MKKLFTTQPTNLPICDRQLLALPEDVRFCRRCVTSNQRPRIVFDEEGVCSACRWAEEKRSIDWKEREAMLVDLLDRHRSQNGGYDVIVPASGGKDSGYVTHELKYRYGMHPLTVTWAPFMFTDIGRRNYESFVHAGFDNIFFYPDQVLHRKLSRLTFECNGDAWDPFAWGQKVFAFQMAVKFNIPLIFYGENGELEYGGSPKYKNKPYEDVADFKEHYYKGSWVDEIYQIGVNHGLFDPRQVQAKDLDMYRLPLAERIEEQGLEMHWYSFYKPWVPQENYYYALEHTGFKTNLDRSEGTYTKYASLDDKQDGFHFWMGFLKFGMGRTTRDASMEVRCNHITREEAVALVHRYDGEFPAKYFPEFLEYLDLPEETFHEVTDRFRQPRLWRKVDGRWELTHRVENL